MRKDKGWDGNYIGNSFFVETKIKIGTFCQKKIGVFGWPTSTELVFAGN